MWSKEDLNEDPGHLLDDIRYACVKIGIGTLINAYKHLTAHSFKMIPSGDQERIQSWKGGGELYCLFHNNNNNNNKIIYSRLYSSYELISCKKFLNTTVCYRKYYCLGEAMAPQM